MKKALAFALALTMAATMMAGCGKKEKETEAATEAATEAGVEAEETEKTTSGDTYQAALLVPGTLGDKSFWDSSNEGLTKLRDELGEDVFNFKVEQMGGDSADMANYEPTFLDYCDSGEYDVIITVPGRQWMRC